MIGVLSFYITMMRRSRLTYLMMILLLGVSIGFMWLTYFDSSRVNTAKHKCPNVPNSFFKKKPANRECHYARFVTICVIDAFAALAWLLLAVFTSVYKHNAEDRSRSKTARTKKQQKKRSYAATASDDEDENGDEDPLLNKAGNGKGTYVYEDYVTPKGRNRDNDNDEGTDEYGNVDFDSESRKRYPQQDRYVQKQKEERDKDFSEDPAKRQRDASHSKEKQLRSKQSGLSVKYNKEDDIDFSQMAEANDDSTRSGRAGSHKLQSALDAQAARNPPPARMTASPAPASPKPSSPAPAKSQSSSSSAGSYKNNGDFDFESLEGNNGFGDD